ncbi:hypothetical protein DL96DRAFT_1416420, partial [Flagelloscypha sp. PMI_526]
VQSGLIPCAPHTIKLCFSVSLLEIFQKLHCECPRLTIQPFLRAFCQIQCRPYSNFLAERFTIALDLYIQLSHHVEMWVDQKLERGADDWHFRHFCPVCTHEVQEEPALQFKLLVTIDGNESLKRIGRRKLETREDGSQARTGPSAERPDQQSSYCSFFLPRMEVDQFAKDTTSPQ